MILYFILFALSVKCQPLSVKGLPPSVPVSSHLGEDHYCLVWRIGGQKEVCVSQIDLKFPASEINPFFSLRKVF